MKFIIIEDEPLSAKHISNLLQRIDESHKVLQVLDSVQTAVHFLSKASNYDAIIADINLSDGLSFDVFNQVEVRVPVIFTTAYDEYSVRAFKLNSVDFLLKPVGIEDLSAAIDKALAAKHDNPRGLTLSGVSYVLRKDYKKRFLVKDGTEMLSITQNEITFFRTDQSELKVCIGKGKLFAIDFAIDELEQLLDPTIFFRINKSTIVHYKSVDAVLPDLNGQLFIKSKFLDAANSFVSREKAIDFAEWVKR